MNKLGEWILASAFAVMACLAVGVVVVLTQGFGWVWVVPVALFVGLTAAVKRWVVPRIL